MRFCYLLLSGLLTIHATGAQERYAVIINEIMADPSPQIGLPNYEWIELKNRSDKAINLQNWRIGDASGQSGPLPGFILEPDSMVIICSSGAATALNIFGKTIAVTSFPSLDNEGEVLFLKDTRGMTMHAVNYSVEWYRNELKKDGGWSLEMIDPTLPCEAKNNWKASIHETGGTPGKINSVHGIVSVQTDPRLVRAYTTDDRSIFLVFDKTLDSLSGTILSNYKIEGGASLQSAKTVGPLFTEVLLTTINPMTKNILYNIEAKNIKDCNGNELIAGRDIKFGLVDDPMQGECIINEILFNPKPNGRDYVELYNNSRKIFNAAKLFIANRNSSGQVSSVKQLSDIPFLIFPGDYIVVTEDAISLALNYLVKEPVNVLAIPALPSFPDAKGNALVLNSQGQIIDEVQYDDSWHFKLITDVEGISLERIDPFGSSIDPVNWHSAASTAGYGTPTYKNSQYINPGNVSSMIEVKPRIFSPDNDGFDDILTIWYKMDKPGYVANITIFDASGRPVRTLIRSALLGDSGYWTWDGLDDKGQKMNIGIYIILVELFNLEGKSHKIKNTIVLARKLN